MVLHRLGEKASLKRHLIEGWFSHQSRRSRRRASSHPCFIVWIHHRTRGSSKTSSAGAQILTDSFADYVSASVQYPGHYSGVNIRDKPFQCEGAIHHGYSCYTRVIFDGHCFAVEFPARGSFDVTAPVPMLNHQSVNALANTPFSPATPEMYQVLRNLRLFKSIRLLPATASS